MRSRCAVNTVVQAAAVVYLVWRIAAPCSGLTEPVVTSCDDGVGGDEQEQDEPRPARATAVPPAPRLRLRVLGRAPFWPTHVLIETHQQDLVQSLLQVALWEHHRDPTGVLKSNKRDGGWHSVNLINASAALGSLR